MQIGTLTCVVSASLVVLLAAAVSCAKDDQHDTKVTFDGVAEVPAHFMAELQKRAGDDKWNKGFNDYHHLRFGRSDPSLIASDDLPPFYRYPPFSPNYQEKRASFGSDYGHMRFGRRVPSFTDYGHLRFG